MMLLALILLHQDWEGPGVVATCRMEGERTIIAAIERAEESIFVNVESIKSREILDELQRAQRGGVKVIVIEGSQIQTTLTPKTKPGKLNMPGLGSMIIDSSHFYVFSPVWSTGQYKKTFKYMWLGERSSRYWSQFFAGLREKK